MEIVSYDKPVADERAQSDGIGTHEKMARIGTEPMSSVLQRLYKVFTPNCYRVIGRFIREEKLYLEVVDGTRQARAKCPPDKQHLVDPTTSARVGESEPPVPRAKTVAGWIGTTSADSESRRRKAAAGELKVRRASLDSMCKVDDLCFSVQFGKFVMVYAATNKADNHQYAAKVLDEQQSGRSHNLRLKVFAFDNSAVYTHKEHFAQHFLAKRERGSLYIQTNISTVPFEYIISHPPTKRRNIARNAR